MESSTNLPPGRESEENITGNDTTGILEPSPYTTSKVPAENSIPFGLRVLLWFCGITLLVGLAESYLGMQPFHGVWDDAYMFTRYADNIRAHGVIAWNTDTPPTYGLTSVFFLLIVIPVRLLTPHNPVLTATLSSLLCGGIFFLLLLRLLNREGQNQGLISKVFLLVVLASFVGCVGHLANHFVSGMDTMFALAYITGYLLLIRRLEGNCPWPTVIGIGIYGGLAFGVRPDLLIYTFVVPLLMRLRDSRPEVQRRMEAICGVTVLLVGAQMLSAAKYFGSPVPLPFYAKALGLYTDFNYARYRPVPLRELMDYLMAYRFPILLIGADLVCNFRQRCKRSSLEFGLLVATALFLAYYLFGVLQIMHDSQRFYYPTLPAILLLAARSLFRLVRRIPPLVAQALRASPRMVGIFLTLVVVVGLLPIPVTLVEDIRPHITPFNITAEYRAFLSRCWFRLDAFSKLPDDLIIATTDVGHPAVMNPHKTIVDLAALNDTFFARQRFSAELFLSRYHPDLIYMPHPDYRGMIQDLTTNPRFLREYVWYPSEQLNTTFGVALRRDSRHFREMQEIMDRYRVR